MTCTVIKYPNIGTLTGTFTPSGLQNGGLVTRVVLSSTDWTPLPPVPLANRNAINLQNYSGDDMVLNYRPDIVGFVGVELHDQSERNYDIKETIILYAKAKISGAIIIVEEIS